MLSTHIYFRETIMKREIQTAIRSAEDLGDDAFAIAMLTPKTLGNALELGRDVVAIPWSILKGTTEIAAEKVDDTVSMVV